LSNTCVFCASPSLHAVEIRKKSAVHSLVQRSRKLLCWKKMPLLQQLQSRAHVRVGWKGASRQRCACLCNFATCVRIV
jgi:hypothetical protein